MINIDKDYLITVDLKNTKVKSDKTIFFYNTDLNICNIFIKLICTDEDKTIPDDLIVEFAVLKPETDEFKPLDATLISKEDLLYQVDLTTDYFDIIGKYECEIRVSGTIENELKCFTSEEFDYVVKPNITAKLNKKIKNDKNLPILEKLIKDVKEITDGINKNEIQMKRDENLVGDNKSIVGAINQLREDVNSGIGGGTVDLTNYQKKNDEFLNTDEKTITGGINEVNNKIKKVQESQIELDKDDVSFNGIDDISHDELNTTNKTIIGAINEVFQSASNGKALIANAITGKGVKADVNDTFEELANKIMLISMEKVYGNINTNVSSLEVTENNTFSLLINLDKAPTQAQEVKLLVNSNQISLDKYTLNFDKTNYSIQQTINGFVEEDLKSMDDVNTTIEVTSNDSKVIINIKIINITKSYIVDGIELDVNLLDEYNLAKGNTSIHDITNTKEFTSYGVESTSKQFTDEGLVPVNNQKFYKQGLTWSENFGNNFAFEFFGSHIPSGAISPLATTVGNTCLGSCASSTDANYLSVLKTKLYYYNTKGEKATLECTFNKVLKDGEIIQWSANYSNPPKINLNSYAHCIINIAQDGGVSGFLNGYPLCDADSNTVVYPVSDFSYLDKSQFETLYILRGNYASGSNPTYQSFRIYNRVLNNEEVNNNLNYELTRLPFSSLDYIPTNYKIVEGTQAPILTKIKSYDKTDDATYSFTDDENIDLSYIGHGIVKVKANTISNTTPIINVVIKNKSKSLNPSIEVVAKKNININQIIQPKGIAVVNEIHELIIGEEYVLYALLYPHAPTYDNPITFKSSNENVLSVKYGVLKANSTGNATITCKDCNNTVSYSFDIVVKEKNEVTYNEYIVKSIDTTDSTTTTNAIIEQIAYAISNNYNYIKFPQGTYITTPTVSQNPTAGVIIIPADLIIDFQNSIINIEESNYTKTGYKMFLFKNKNSKIINANIKGERYSMNISNLDANEGCCSVAFENAENSGLENCSIGNSPGFNIISYYTRKQNIPINIDNIEEGTIDNNGEKNNTDINWNWRTINKINISSLEEHFELGYTLQTGGYYNLFRLYDIAFYDINNNFMSIKRNCCQFTRYDLPQNAYYAHFVFHQENKPDKTTPSGGMIYIYTLNEPIDCFIKNCKISDNYSLGMACCGGKRWVFDGNIFENNKGRDPSAHIDYEDGKEMCNGDIWKNNYFGRFSKLMFVTGQNLAFHDNVFYDSSVVFNSRCLLYRFYNNLFIQENYMTANFKSQASAVVAENVFNFNYNIETKSNRNYYPNSNFEIYDIYNTITTS
jgi:hypothetical protein